MKEIKHIWVVEIDFGDGRGYQPTIGVGIDRESGRVRLAEWRGRNPWDNLRLRKYVREEKK